MGNRLDGAIVTLAAVLLTTNHDARAREVPSATLSPITPAGPGSLSGMRTDRLTPGQLRVWRSIEEIVLARDPEGRPLHPNLCDLWRRVQESGHLVYIQLQDTTKAGLLDFTAGAFSIDTFDPDGKRHVALIKLNLRVIDSAYIAGMPPIRGHVMEYKQPSRQERYAGDLAQELAHALWCFEDAARARMIMEKSDLADRLSEILRDREERKRLGPEIRLLIARVGVLDRVIEEPARTMEAAVWQELAPAASASAAP